MKEVHSKRLAIHLYGHVRTYEKTYKNFYKNIIETNKKDGWEIDIFMHTWDVFSITDHNAWHAKDNLFPTMTGKKLTSSDKHRIVEIYQPKRYIIDPNPNKPAGRFESIKKAMNLRKEYEKDMRITYDYYLTTRPDLLFLKPLRINEYINLYNIQRNLINIGFPDKINFCSCWCFRYPYYLPILDPRFPNESDLLWFGNYCSNKGFDPLIAYREEPNAVNVFIQYRLNMDFIQYREATKSVDYLIFISNSKNEFYINQLNLQTNLDKTIKEKDSIIKSNINHINQLQSNIQEKSAKLDKLSFQAKYGTAKTRIQKQLSYKLGQTMIINSKSFLGYLIMPMALLSIMISHKQEQKVYQEKIKKDPSLKLPPLESYPDYKEALKLKNHLSYKLGEALVQANKTWYKGGYVKMLFEIGKFKRE